MGTYSEYDIDWRGTQLKVRHCPRWLYTSDEFITQHIEVHAESRVPLPITETGYRSCFLNGVAALSHWDDDPVKFVLNWLVEEAKSDQWQAQRA